MVNEWTRDEWKARAEAAEARTAPDVPLHQPDGTRTRTGGRR